MESKTGTLDWSFTSAGSSIQHGLAAAIQLS